MKEDILVTIRLIDTLLARYKAHPAWVQPDAAEPLEVDIFTTDIEAAHTDTFVVAPGLEALEKQGYVTITGVYDAVDATPTTEPVDTENSTFTPATPLATLAFQALVPEDVTFLIEKYNN